MKCLILCAGFGTRLKPLTDDTPKPLLKVNGKPIIQYTIDHLYKLGIKDIAINVHYKANRFVEYLKDTNIKIFHEDEALGTAGAVKNAKDFLDSEEFLVIYGDVICYENFNAMKNFHKQRNALATILVHKNKSNSLIEIGENDKIVKFKERPCIKVSGWTNSGIYIFNKEIFDYIPDGFSDFPKDIFSKLNRYYAFRLKSYRIAIDSYWRLKKAERELYSARIN